MAAQTNSHGYFEHFWSVAGTCGSKVTQFTRCWTAEAPSAPHLILSSVWESSGWRRITSLSASITTNSVDTRMSVSIREGVILNRLLRKMPLARDSRVLKTDPHKSQSLNPIHVPRSPGSAEWRLNKTSLFVIYDLFSCFMLIRHGICKRTDAFRGRTSTRGREQHTCFGLHPNVEAFALTWIVGSELKKLKDTISVFWWHEVHIPAHFFLQSSLSLSRSWLPPCIGHLGLSHSFFPLSFI